MCIDLSTIMEYSDGDLERRTSTIAKRIRMEEEVNVTFSKHNVI